MAQPSIDSVIYSDTLSRDSTPTNIIHLTPLAIKYAEKGSNRNGILSGKSGLTPIERPIGSIPETRLDYETEEVLIRYQRRHLHGFSAQEVNEILAGEDPGAIPSTLHTISAAPSLTAIGNFNAYQQDNVAIMPLLQRDNWIKELGPEVPMGGGFLDAQDDEVWEAIKPSLQLASRILNNTQTSSFYDTLFHGTRQSIDPNRLPRSYIFPQDTQGFYESIWPRSHQLQTVLNTEKSWLDFIPYCTFTIDDCVRDRNSDAVTFMENNSKVAIVIMGTEQVVTLLSSQITESERLKASFTFAATLMHEIAHAIIMYRDGEMRFEEPYYQDEPVSEVGFSAENAVWGGIVSVYAPHRHRDEPNQNKWEPPKFWVGRQEYPSRFMYGHYNSGQPELDTNSLRPGRIKQSSHPMTTKFLEEIQSSAFWNVMVGKYGNDILKDNSQPIALYLLRDNAAPFKSVRSGIMKYTGAVSHRDMTVIPEVDLDVFDAMVAWKHKRNLNGPDEFQKYRASKLRTFHRVYTNIRQRKKDEIRAWRKWGDPDWVPMFHFGLLQDHWFQHQDGVVERIAKEMKITTLALRNRGRDFVQNAVRAYLERNGVPRDHFNFEDQEVLLSYDELKAGVVPTDLDEIYQDILSRERALGTDIEAVIIQPLRVSQRGGNMQGMDSVKQAVQHWLQRNGHDMHRLDDEMNRRHSDTNHPTKTFYIQPELQEIMQQINDEQIRTNKIILRGTAFERAELTRDYLEQNSDYPREALDSQLGRNVLPRDPGNLNVLKQRFLDDCLSDLANGQDKDFTLHDHLRNPGVDRNLILRQNMVAAWNRPALLRSLRRWLLRNQYSTKLDFGLGP